MPISGRVTYPLRWWFRPREEPQSVPTPVVIRLDEGPRVDPEDLGSVLHEFSPRQYAAVREVLLEAKLKAESVLSDEKITSDHGRLAFYTGWLKYADYVLASFESLREGAKELL